VRARLTALWERGGSAAARLEDAAARVARLPRLQHDLRPTLPVAAHGALADRIRAVAAKARAC
jgi:hypothetical protein